MYTVKKCINLSISITLASMLYASMPLSGAEKKELPETALSSKQVDELRKAMIDYKKNRSKKKQEEIITKYAKKYPNDPFVKAKLNEKARFDNPQITQKEPIKEPITQPKPVQPPKKEQPKTTSSRQNNPHIYEQLDILLDQENSRGQSFINWNKVLAFIDQNNINVNDYRSNRAPAPYDEYPVTCGYDKTLLYLAVYYNQLNVVRLLLEKYGANPNVQKLPTNITDPQLVLLLSKHGVQFGQTKIQPKPVQPPKKEQPKTTSSRQNNPHIYEQLDILLDQENSRGQSFINWNKVLAFIDQNNINVNDYRSNRAPAPYDEYPVTCGYDKTLLYLAVYYNQFNPVKILLEQHKANPNLQRLPHIKDPQITLLLSQYGYQF